MKLIFGRVPVQGENSEPLPEELTRLLCIIPPSIGYTFYQICTRLSEDSSGRVLTHYGRWCDGSDCPYAYKEIPRTRYMCFMCIDESSGNTLDFCENCRNTDATARCPSHQISHSLIRCYRHLHAHDQDSIIKRARKLSEDAKSGFRQKVSNRKKVSNRSQSGGSMQCEWCKEEVDLPCWICLDCWYGTYMNPLYFCSTCDTKHHPCPAPEEFFLRPILGPSTPQRGESESIQPSHAMHTMLWIRNDQDAYMPVRDTLTRLEGRLESVEKLIINNREKEQVTARLLSLQRQLGHVMELTWLRDGLGGEDGLVEERNEKIESDVSGRLSALEGRFETLYGLLRRFMDDFRK
ncbi:hypothetical protein E4T56_gene20050 [Termitomyces sp. T112]|nr:hypothetical protein E4T56_gene20050 [Termitomyces sp. T112]